MGKIAIPLMAVLVLSGFAWQDDKEDALVRQREIQDTFTDLEQIVKRAAERMEAREPENAKRLLEAWGAMKDKLIKEDMNEVVQKIQAGSYRSALQKLDEVKKKLSEVLTILMGMAETASANLDELSARRAEWEKLLKNEKENKEQLDALKQAVNPQLQKLKAEVQEARERQEKNREQAAKIPGNDLLALMRDVVERLKSVGSLQDQAIQQPQQDRQEPVGKALGDLQPVMDKTFLEVHRVAGRYAHHFQEAVTLVKDAATDGGKALEAITGQTGSPKDLQQSTLSHVREAELVVRRILEELENKEKEAGESQKEQGDIGKKIDELSREAQKQFNQASSQKVAEKLQSAKENLTKAKDASDRAEKEMAQSPIDAAHAQEEAEQDLAEAAKSIDEAAQESQKSLGAEQKQQAQAIQKKEQANAEAANQSASKNSPSGKQESSQQAAQEMRQASENLQSGNLEEASQAQAQAIEKLQEVAKEAREQEKQQLAQTLASRLGHMIEDQTRINQVTEKLDKVRKTAGDLVRAEKFELQEIADKEKELTDDAAQVKEIAIKAEAQSIAFYLDAVALDMAGIHKLLADSKTDTLTQKVERDVLEMLQSLTVAIRQSAAQPAKSGEGEKKEGGAGQPKDEKKDESAKKDEPLPPEVEIRLLIELQKQVRERTDEIGRWAAQDPSMSVFLSDVLSRQKILVDRLHEIIQRVGK